ncbi:MAG TPA: DinB family protein [Ktedonobacteraceae bacterium]|nr:DinB family protein [Ktedonobacteraceae bacterium]
MTLYQLYLESGPLHKKTMVHILDLLGCIARGPTTEDALAGTPDAIRVYLRFLQRHGEAVKPEEEIQTKVAEHITEGTWLGNGDPELLFQPDLKPLSTKELEIYIRHLEWSRADIQELVSGLSDVEVEAKPSAGRPIKAILEHIFGAEYSYMQPFGKLDGIRGPAFNTPRSKDELLKWMGVLRAGELQKLRSLSSKQLSEPFARGKYTRTTRRILRRMLEHEWEHLVELQERLATG